MKCKKTGITLKTLDDEGHGLARIATLSAIDHDGDTYEAGAFGGADGEQWAQILGAHNWNMVPLGKARVFERGDEALAELHMNLGTDAGKEWHAALKFDLEGGAGAAIQEWSYGFRVLDAGREERDGDQVRVLKRLKVFEVSPVVQGAGVNTGTLVMKGAALKDERFERLTEDITQILASVQADPATLSATGRKQIASLEEGLGQIRKATEAEDALVRRLIAGQSLRASKRHLKDS